MSARAAAALAGLRVLASLLRGQPRAATHAGRLQAFYAPQAAHYDAFRERLLHGRADLVAALAPPAGARVVELGAGTGRNAEYFGSRLPALDLTLVDLCPALLGRAAVRARCWPTVSVVEADATTWRPPAPVDAVYCAYSLTMIPDWRAAIDNAHAMLRPGGLFGAVDFYVSERRPRAGLVRHGALARALWPRWFGHAGVHPSPEHLPLLLDRFTPVVLRERSGPLPWLPGLRVPYYVFVGRRRRDGAAISARRPA